MFTATVHMPHLLRFLLLSTTPANAGRIISQIRDQLKFVGVIDSYSVRNKKLEGIISAQSTEASILDALRSSLRFKNITNSGRLLFPYPISLFAEDICTWLTSDSM
ncbi:hypothetical protein MA16_Dca028280 [Dendrobium catenatum]|uniref:Uncharacterized protein n=1 Tax=Dendrobium catenatum TaxID=906689 RepID=A0A2I0VH33_9ASPA|nr:hypothetical protein MA16_Dca028280 [Dendrobium catenatum]